MKLFIAIFALLIAFPAVQAEASHFNKHVVHKKHHGGFHKRNFVKKHHVAKHHAHKKHFVHPNKVFYGHGPHHKKIVKTHPRYTHYNRGYVTPQKNL